jgi:CDP-6-deoxy-D-xylo-4-hexulose-3-dehydrase
MNKNLNWPLMNNNISRKDLDVLIDYLSMDNPKLTHGNKVIEFEKNWSDWLGTKNSVMVNSGSSANDLTMLAIREILGPGEIIVPPLTWVSDIASVLHAGHKPIFVDIDPHSLAINIEGILGALTPNTKAVFLTHVLGFNGLTDSLLKELSKRNILLIEDVCESHGATHNGQKVGTFGFASNFSYYYAHHMTTIEGGMISSNDENFIDFVRMSRSHGLLRESKNEKYRNSVSGKNKDLNSEFIFTSIGHNMRPTEINGVLGLSQLENLDRNVEVRNSNFVKFLGILDPNIFKTDFKTEGSSNYAFTLVLRNKDFELRDKIEKTLREHNIEFRRGLSGGGNQLRQPYLKNRIDVPSIENFPEVEHVHHFGWYIGNYPDLDVRKIEQLGEILFKVV